MDPKERVLKILSDAKRDDLERAERAFAGCDLDVLHGESGRTRGNILEGYKRERHQWEEAYRFAERHLPAGLGPF